MPMHHFTVLTFNYYILVITALPILTVLLRFVITERILFAMCAGSQMTDNPLYSSRTLTILNYYLESIFAYCVIKVDTKKLASITIKTCTMNDNTIFT